MVMSNPSGPNETSKNWADVLSAFRDVLALAAVVAVFTGYVFRYEKLSYLGLNASQFGASITDEVASVFQVVKDEPWEVAAAILAAFILMLGARYLSKHISPLHRRAQAVTMASIAILLMGLLFAAFSVADQAARREVAEEHADLSRTALVWLSQRGRLELCSNDPLCTYKPTDLLAHELRADLQDILAGRSRLIEEDNNWMYFLVQEVHDPPKGRIVRISRDDIGAIIEDPKL
jgi:hypothetical protein